MVKSGITHFLIMLICCTVSMTSIRAEDGYRLWLRYDKISDENIRAAYLERLTAVYMEGDHPIIRTSINELQKGLSGLLDRNVSFSEDSDLPNILVAGVIGSSAVIENKIAKQLQDQIKEEGYLLKTIDDQLVLAAKDEKGLLYGVFALLRKIQTHESIENIQVIENPRIKLRVLNHWDNLDRTVERGYAGFSIWNWHELPDFIDRRYTEYARANASIGINGTVVTNVNANALIFRKDYLEKAAALANVFRPYGIKLYLTARFSAPIEQGGLTTADPLDEKVIQWWQDKVDEIYQIIPDFGGFLVKANSEGQPGPQEYNRTHADGANLLADALAPHGGIVMWRAFVYSHDEPEDRAKQAYNEFVPLDGKFRNNVLIQVKNGPIDFQPREPVHPLFMGMKHTPIMMEFQITKEYLGQGTHLVGLTSMYQEILQTDVYSPDKALAKIVDGTLTGQELTGIAGVSNIGNSRNWTGNLFGQADWYGFGRLAWKPDMSSEAIYEEWVKMTLTHDKNSVELIKEMLKNSYETCVNYMTPLGLHHIMAAGHHYGPGPWVSEMPRADWTSVYYHKADTNGIGFDRTRSGSNALSQYPDEFSAQYQEMDRCPLNLLLWFHHVPWDHVLPTKRTLWEELCRAYQKGVDGVAQLSHNWMKLEDFIDEERFEHVNMHLVIQQKEAKWWRDACLSYFQTFSKMDIPDDIEKPSHNLAHYKSIIYPYSPGIRPRW